MPVNSRHPQYDAAADEWEIVRKIIKNDAKDLLPTIDPDPSEKDRNTKYKDNAILTNFTALTQRGLAGCAMRHDPTVELPPELEYLLDDATGGKKPLSLLTQEIVQENIAVGRVGIYVDYPQAEEGLNAAQTQDLKARMQMYATESIINWQQEYVGGQWLLSFVVLEEVVNKLQEDGFAWIQEKQYRVLSLQEGVYTVTRFNKDLVEVDEFQPRGNDGASLNFIPFYFCGSEDNNACPDKAPMYDLSVLNLGHYKNSADYEENVHMHGQSTLFITTAMSADDWDRANPNGIQVGSQKGHNLGDTGSATLLQGGANTLVVEAMREKENQAVMLGARLITPNNSNETVDAARMRHSGETSTLEIIVNNVEAALYHAIQGCTVYMGGNPELVELELNRQFYDKSLDPNEIMAQIQLKQEGIVAVSDVRDQLRSTGQLDAGRTDEDIDDEVEQEDVFE